MCAARSTCRQSALPPRAFCRYRAVRPINSSPIHRATLLKRRVLDGSICARTSSSADNVADSVRDAGGARPPPPPTPLDDEPTAPPPPLVAERGPPLFAPGGAFYRAESAQARDLAVLAASVRRAELLEDGGARLSVLDVMCGSGGRGARYLAQAGADEVWSNDHDARNLPLAALNLAAGAEAGAAAAGDGRDGGAFMLPLRTAADVERAGRRRLREADAVRQVPGLIAPVHEWRTKVQAPRTGGKGRGGGEAGAKEQEIVARASCADAGRLLAALSLRAGAEAAAAAAKGDDDDAPQQPSSSSPAAAAAALFQLVDLDSFGSAGTHLVSQALGTIAYGGLLFLTSTDGFVSSGKRPERALAAYGAYTRPLPGAAEQGLRAVIGHAAREAAAQGLSVEPLFSYYSFHGPVFRVMLRVTRGAKGKRRRRRRTRRQGHDGDDHDGDDDDDDDENENEAEKRLRQQRHAQPSFNSRLYGFVGRCRAHGETAAVTWDDLGRGSAGFCPVCRRLAAAAGGGGGSITAAPGAPADLAGPMWLGPLHDGDFVAAMTAEAERRGWLVDDKGGGARSSSSGGAKSAAAERVRLAERDAKAHYTGRTSRTNPQLPLAELLSVMREEADPKLPPLYLEAERLGRLLTRCPPRDALVGALRSRGWAAARCQLERRALRTDAPLEEVLRVAEEAFEGCAVRAGVKDGR